MENSPEFEIEGVRGYPALVRANNAFGDDASLLTLAKAKAFDPSIFEESPPFFWTAEISNNSIDAYFSKMMPSSLKNYAADAESGVGFQNCHNCRELSIGRSLVGRFIGGQGNGAARVEAAFYTIPDLQLSNLNTSEFIRGVRSGVTKDVSIGFYAGRSVCSICKNDMWDWMSGTCIHWPGEEYDTHDNSEKVSAREVAIEQIEDARLAEVSAVYDGATPGAVIQKARAQIEAGNLKPETKRVLEARYRIRLPGKRVQIPGYSGDDKKMAETKEAPALDLREDETLDFGDNQELAARVAEILKTRQTEIDQLKSAQVESTDERVTKLEADLQRLRPLADAGETYRNDLIEQALTEGVRAQGNAFPKEVQRGMLEKASIEEIKKVRDGFKAAGDERLKGGRQSVDTVEQPKQTNVTIPAAAFAV